MKLSLLEIEQTMKNQNNEDWKSMREFETFVQDPIEIKSNTRTLAWLVNQLQCRVDSVKLW